MIDNENIWQVVPIKDKEPHDETIHYPPIGLPYCGCRCKPEHQEQENGGLIIVHNSFDGREGVEWANEILNPTT